MNLLGRVVVCVVVAVVLCLFRPLAAVVVIAAFAVSIVPVSAQTAFTLPAPPFELPGLPSPSGGWTATVGLGAEYKPEYEGSRQDKVSPEPNFTIRWVGFV